MRFPVEKLLLSLKINVTDRWIPSSMYPTFEQCRFFFLEYLFPKCHRNRRQKQEMVYICDNHTSNDRKRRLHYEGDRVIVKVVPISAAVTPTRILGLVSHSPVKSAYIQNVTSIFKTCLVSMFHQEIWDSLKNTREHLVYRYFSH